MKATNGKKHTGGGYKYVHSFNDNRGKRRWRYYRRGYPSQYLPSPDSPDFIAAYTAALQRPKNKIAQKGYTLGHAIDDYRGSRAFTDLAEGTKTGYESKLTRMGEAYGRYRVKTLTRRDLQAILEKIDSTNKRNRYLSMFNLILDAAIDKGKIEHNVARDIKRVKHRTQGYKTWSHKDIRVFEAKYPEGTTERLALYLLYYTGQRSSDVYQMGDDCLKDGFIHVTQKKTKTPLIIPVHPKLAHELPSRDIWLQTQYGKDFSRKGFQQWFVRKAKAAGLEGLSGHGLRKSLATHLADKGATPHQIRSITGHADLSQVSLYTRKANQLKLAQEAIDMLD